MIEINLLPKDYLKKSISFAFGKTGLYAVAAVVGITLMLIGVTFYQMHQLNKLEDNIAKARQRAAMLEKDIQLVDALTDVKGKITSRMVAVERLDSHRSTWVRILQDVARNVPEFVWLGRFTEEALKDSVAQPGQEGNEQETEQQPTVAATPTVHSAEVEGYAFTLNALASFMIKMMRSDYFDEVELVLSDEVKFQDHKAYNFVLTCNLHYLSEEHLRDLIAQAGNTGGSQKGKTSHRSLN
jgi:Tfp pilus assembly protein PilN